MAGLDSDGADSEAEWAARILASIGITPETPDGNEPPIMVQPAIPPAIPPVIGSPLKLPFVKPIRASTEGW